MPTDLFAGTKALFCSLDNRWKPTCMSFDGPSLTWSLGTGITRVPSAVHPTRGLIMVYLPLSASAKGFHVDSTLDGRTFSASYFNVSLRASYDYSAVVVPHTDTLLLFGVRSKAEGKGSFAVSLDLAAGTWTDIGVPPGANLTKATCGLALNRTDGRRYVIVGTPMQRSFWDPWTENRVSILNLEDMSWRQGANRLYV